MLGVLVLLLGISTGIAGLVLLLTMEQRRVGRAGRAGTLARGLRRPFSARSAGATR